MRASPLPVTMRGRELQVRGGSERCEGRFAAVSPVGTLKWREIEGSEGVSIHM